MNIAPPRRHHWVSALASHSQNRDLTFLPHRRETHVTGRFGETVLDIVDKDNNVSFREPVSLSL
jgi:hypothetical protein